VTICESVGPICKSLITVGLRSGLGFGFSLRLQIVVYNPLEKVTKCGSII